MRLPGETGEQKDEQVPRKSGSPEGRQAAAEGRRQRGRLRSGEADGKEWPPGNFLLVQMEKMRFKEGW